MKKLLLSLVAILFAINAYAQPSTITYQGVLTDGDGELITDTPDIQFALFDAETNGNPLWTEAHENVTVSNGLFQVELNSVNNDWGTANFATQMWLEITVAGTTLSPRVKFNASGHSFNADNLSDFTASDYLYNTKYGVKLTPNSAQTDVDIVLQPKAIGSILADQPDGTATGGNNRGENAVDLQIIRFNSTEVASGGNSTISGGVANTAGGDYSTVSGGTENTASELYSTVGGGITNTASEQYSTVGGGSDNTAGGEYSTVGGGNWNAASGERATVCGGFNNTASGYYATVCGGRDNTAYDYAETVLGLYATIGSGSQTSRVDGDRLFVVGNGTADGSRSNALTILKNANTTIGGSLTLNGNGTGTSYALPTGRGTNGQVLTTDGSGGTSWAAAGEKYEVGDFAQGGIVFWVDETGQHGLVAAKVDQDGGSGIQWYNGSYTDTEAHGDGVYAGEMNTMLIIANQGSNSNVYAAGVCANYTVTESGVTYGDWYLPSKEELNLMYQNKATIDATAGSNGGSSFASAYYWSSTEGHGGNAWLQGFGNGYQNYYSKSSAYKVRAVRAF